MKYWRERRMQNEKNTTPADPANLLFVHAYYYLPGVAEAEWLDYSSLNSLGYLRYALQEHLKLQWELFCEGAYQEFFSLMNFDCPEGHLLPGELSVFYAALDPEFQGIPLDDLDSKHIFQGFRAIIAHRVSHGDVLALHAAVDLFNEIMALVLDGVSGENPQSWITLKEAKEFAPGFLADLLASIRLTKEPWRYDQSGERIGEELAPLKPLLERLQKSVNHEGWPRNNLELGRFLLVVDHCKQLFDEIAAR